MREWVPIARARYLVATSAVRSWRRYLLLLCYGFVAVFVGYLVPTMVASVTDEITAFLLSAVAVASLQLFLFMFFFYLLLFPVSRTLQEEQSGEQELLLKAPVRPGAVLLGNFMGMLPFYALVIVALSGLLAALLQPLGVDLLQTAIILIVSVAVLLSGLWIGIVLAAVLKTRLSKTARGRDIGKALAFIIALPLIAVMYAAMGGALGGALADPNTDSAVRTVMAVFPSSWGADLLVAFARHPGDIGAVWVQTVVELGAVLAFFAGSLWVGARIANRAYRLDTGSFSSPRVKPEGAFYRRLRALVRGRSFGTIVVSVFKDYGRRLQNLSKVAYVAGIMLLLNFFLVEDSDPFAAFLMLAMILPFGAAFVMGEVTARGKETLFVYRKAPSGESRLVAARLLHGWTVMLPLAAAVAAVAMVVAGSGSIPTVLAFVGLLVLLSAGQVVFALGLFLIAPVFTDKPAELMVNAMVLMMTTMGLIFGSLFAFGDAFAPFVVVGVTWALGAVALSLGRRHLSLIE